MFSSSVSKKKSCAAACAVATCSLVSAGSASPSRGQLRLLGLCGSADLSLPHRLSVSFWRQHCFGGPSEMKVGCSPPPKIFPAAGYAARQPSKAVPPRVLRCFIEASVHASVSGGASRPGAVGLPCWCCCIVGGPALPCDVEAYEDVSHVARGGRPVCCCRLGQPAC